jgi:hypothetical protein
MTVTTDFTAFLDNLKIKDAAKISQRYGNITRRLNMKFRNTEDRSSNSLQAGSYGRFSGINGISDLDMLYIMPASLWNKYNGNQSDLLDACKSAISETYRKTTLKKDRNVVVVSFTNFDIEVVPVFLQTDGKFKYPDTYDGGSWNDCDTRAELEAFKVKNKERNKNLRKLAKMVRAWKMKNEIVMSGFLIDTLCYRFLDSNTNYDSTRFSSYDNLIKDFFNFLVNEPDKKYYVAMGSGSHVTISKDFKKVAAEALENSTEAIKARTEGYEGKCNKYYKRLFGTSFPNREVVSVAKSLNTTEMFIEDMYTKILDKNTIDIECEIKDDKITQMLSKLWIGKERIQHQKKLNFYIGNHDISGNFDLKWKILNQGDLIDKNGNYRGQILDDEGTRSRKETATFHGDHIVECYAIQHGVVIARDRIIVPIA